MLRDAPRPAADRSFRRGSPASVFAVCLVCFAILFSTLTALLFVWPPSGRLRPADAVVSLNGNDEQARTQAAVSLVEKGYAPLLLFSRGHSDTPCPSVPGATVVCFVPNPNRTVGEMAFAADFARAHHLDRLIVVAGHEQAVRAAVLSGRCIPVPTEVVPAPVSWRAVPFQALYEWGALIKATVVDRNCGS